MEVQNRRGAPISPPFFAVSFQTLASDCASAMPRFKPCPAMGWIECAASLGEVDLMSAGGRA